MNSPCYHAQFEDTGEHTTTLLAEFERGLRQFGGEGVRFAVGDDRGQRMAGVEQHMGADQGGQLQARAVVPGGGRGLGQAGRRLLVADAHQLGEHMPFGGPPARGAGRRTPARPARGCFSAVGAVVGIQEPNLAMRAASQHSTPACPDGVPGGSGHARPVPGPAGGPEQYCPPAEAVPRSYAEALLSMMPSRSILSASCSSQCREP